MSTSSPSKVSFTIRRPTPPSRGDSGIDSDSAFKVPSLPRRLGNDSGHSSPFARSAEASPKPVHYNSDSSDEDEEVEDELVAGFDQFGVQRLHEKKKQGPLVIPPLKNCDWREMARKRKSLTQYVPSSAQAGTGADGSVGGLGTKDTINSGTQLSGLQVSKRVKTEEDMEDVRETEEPEDTEVKAEMEETEDQKALRAILTGTGQDNESGSLATIIPQPVSEEDALRQDVEDLPDEATLEDYARVPVSQFGAALLRGMGWKEGTAASRKNKGPVEPYLPTARPALLGIGAKEREPLDDGSKSKKGSRRPERRYVPVVKREKSAGESYRDDDRGSSGTHSGRGTSSRRRTPSPQYSSSRRSSRSPSRRYRDERRNDGDNSYDRRAVKKSERDYGDGRNDDRSREERRRDHRNHDADRDRGEDGSRRRDGRDH